MGGADLVVGADRTLGRADRVVGAERTLGGADRVVGAERTGGDDRATGLVDRTGAERVVGADPRVGVVRIRAAGLEVSTGSRGDALPALLSCPTSGRARTLGRAVLVGVSARAPWSPRPAPGRLLATPASLSLRSPRGTARDTGRSGPLSVTRTAGRGSSL
ncbi:MAG: hypothetical protein F4187_08700 [Gemmatimonadetes bacterium]|nr:hypothetical protein [Gemmatimonadota bacterium]